MSTVAGLPKFVVLKSKSDGKYLHCLRNDPSFDNYVGCMRNLDPVDPLVKFEVVPSSSNPTQLVHLRCSHNNKFLELQIKYYSPSWISWVTATANGTDESTTRTKSTLFRPIFPAREPNTVGFLHVQKNCHVRTYGRADVNDRLNGFACVQTNDGDGMHRFEFAAWESHDDSDGQVKDREIQQLRVSNVASMNAKDREIRNLKSSYEEKMKAKDGEIASYVEKMKVNEGDIMKKVEASYMEKMKAKDDEMKKVEAGYMEKMKAKNDEMKKVEASCVEKMKAKNDEIKELISKGKDNSGTGDGRCQQVDDIIAELRLEIAELKVLLDYACRENDDLKEAVDN